MAASGDESQLTTIMRANDHAAPIRRGPIPASNGEGQNLTVVPT